MAQIGMVEILDPLPATAGAFSPTDWLVVAAVSMRAEPNSISRLCNALGEREDGAPDGEGAARMHALGAMAGLINNCGPQRFASHINCFLEAGFTGEQLCLLADSLAASKDTWSSGAERRHMG